MITRAVALFALAFSVSACGDDGSGSGPPMPGQGGAFGGGGTGGSAGSSSGGSVATGGAAGSGSGGTPACDQLLVTGDLDGSAVDTSLTVGAQVFSGHSGTQWSYRLLLSGGGILSLGGDAATDPVEGDPVTGVAYLATPPGSTFAGAHFVSKAASMKYMDSHQPIVLGSLERVGACPGAAATGSLALCVESGLGSATPCGATGMTVQGTLDGAAVDETPSKGGHEWIQFAGVEVMRSDVGTDGTLWLHDFGGPPLAGFLVLPSAAWDPGALLCVGDASIVKGSDHFDVTLTSLSKGGAPPATSVNGTLQLVHCE